MRLEEWIHALIEEMESFEIDCDRPNGGFCAQCKERRTLRRQLIQVLKDSSDRRLDVPEYRDLDKHDPLSDPLYAPPK